MARNISVYADWAQLTSASKLGTLYAHAGGGKEIFEFEFEPAAISNVDIASTPLDPRLTYFPGRQHPPDGQLFGLFAEASLPGSLPAHITLSLSSDSTVLPMGAACTLPQR